jgi:hypothetical protein
VFSSSEEQTPGPLLEDPEKHPKYADYKVEMAKIQKEFDDYTTGEAVRLAAGMMERTGDYLLLAHQTAKTTDTSKKGGNFRLAARDRGLKAEIAQSSSERLREIETANKKKADAVFAPWFALASLPAEGFADKSREVLGKLGEGGGVSAAILTALAEAAPSSLEEVAKVYTGVFERLHKAMAFAEFETRSRNGGGALAKSEKSLEDAVMEELRKAVIAPGGSMLPSEAITARTLGAAFNNGQAAIRARMASLDLTHEGAPVRAMSMTDRANPRNSPVLIRGEATNKGPVAWKWRRPLRHGIIP